MSFFLGGGTLQVNRGRGCVAVDQEGESEAIVGAWTKCLDWQSNGLDGRGEEGCAEVTAGVISSIAN
jgi:hypothetical protein